jgi:hypothetical protein
LIDNLLQSISLNIQIIERGMILHMVYLYLTDFRFFILSLCRILLWWFQSAIIQ